VVDETPLNGDVLHEYDWFGPNKQYKSWTTEGWGFVCICRIEEIEITE
jgi:hypothetical protein